jgi:2-polyprenyl-3-methyl-5-hydroxy-6-metoxy-1,4-benzoquinol methylase
MKALEQRMVVPPTRLSDLMWGPRSLHVVRSALDLDIFSKLADKPTDAVSLAKEHKLDARGLLCLLDALAALEIIDKNGDQYSLSELSREYLLPASKLYLGAYMQRNEMIERSWEQLTAVIRSGKPEMKVNSDKQAEEFFPKLAESIFPLSYAFAQQVAQELKFAQLPGAPRVLDVACGSAVWSIPFAEAHVQATVDGLDFPAIIKVAEKFTQRHEVADRYSYITGNWRDVQWKKNEYDLVILGHILHSEGQAVSEQLLKQCHEALKPGGHLLIAEMISNDKRTGPLFPLIFAINMFLLTEDGCVFSEGELSKMLATAGFSRSFRTPHGDQDSPVMIAVK